ncbi:MAG TPA: REP-associated tyrosine transposase [Candidatus Hypogeohydataceae bacterium YC38]|nr:transposase [Candidatus Brocadiales bacterium]
MSRPKHLASETQFYFVTTNIEGHSQIFTSPNTARTVIDSIYFLRARGYLKLHAFVIMPDHLHLIISTPSDKTLPQIMHSLKSFSSKKINKQMGRTGKVWQDGYYAYGIRGPRDMEVKMRYLLENPVRKGLSQDIITYSYSSGNGTFEVDSW